MKRAMIMFLQFFSLAVSAQNEALEQFLQRAWEKERSLQSGEVSKKESYYANDSLFNESEEKLIFFHEPENAVHHYLIDVGMESIFFSNGNTFEHYYRGYRRQWADPRRPDEFTNRAKRSFQDFCLSFEPESCENSPYQKYLRVRSESGDSMLNWDPITQTLQIKHIEIQSERMKRNSIVYYKFNEDSLLERVTEMISTDYSKARLNEKIVREYSYSRLNSIPYFYIRQKLKELENAPLLSVFRPETISIKQHPSAGMEFPDLVFMDAIGRTKKLSGLPGPKILVYPFSPLHSDLQVISFIDSMEDVHPEWEFMIITHTNVDELDAFLRKHPNLKSFYLASQVDGLELNGWPIWFILDKDRVVLAENHGYQPYRNKEFEEWIKEHLRGE